MQFSTLRPRFLVRAALVLACLVPATLALKAATTQIPAGSTAALGSTQPYSLPSAKTPQGKILKTALNSDTRKTLQEAMDSVDVSAAAR